MRTRRCAPVARRRRHRAGARACCCCCASARHGRRVRRARAAGDADGRQPAIVDPGSRRAATLFLANCSTCHGLNAEGSDDGAEPDRRRRRGGRLPGRHRPHAAAADRRRRPSAKHVEFNAGGDRRARRLRRLARPRPGDPGRGRLDYADADLAEGGELFRTNCAMCHNFAGSGGALTHGKYAPSLNGVTPKHIYEAMLTGPQSMPVFSDGTMTPEDKRAIIALPQDARGRAEPGRRSRSAARPGHRGPGRLGASASAPSSAARSGSGRRRDEPTDTTAHPTAHRRRRPRASTPTTRAAPQPRRRRRPPATRRATPVRAATAPVREPGPARRTSTAARTSTPRPRSAPSARSRRCSGCPTLGTLLFIVAYFAVKPADVRRDCSSASALSNRCSASALGARAVLHRRRRDPLGQDADARRRGRRGAQADALAPTRTAPRPSSVLKEGAEEPASAGAR